MDAGNTDALILPVPPEPFALIVGAVMRKRSADALETALRRMGLRPERVERDIADIAGPRFRLHFGAVSVLAGPAADGARDIANPDHP